MNPSKIEYKIVPASYLMDEAELNELGVQGWILVCVVDSGDKNDPYPRYHFLRHVPAESAQQEGGK